ncbi:MAG: hypothetical protein AAF485_28045, partial [Chloroflexota bacterium]
SGYALEGGSPVAPQQPAAQGGTQQPSSRNNPGDRIRVAVSGHRLALIGGSFQDMLATVKTLPGRRFNGQDKIWEIPGDVGVIKGLVEAAGFVLEGADKIDLGSVAQMEEPSFTPQPNTPDPALDFEPLDFSPSGELPVYEPPNWEDWDDNTPPPSPPDWWDDESAPPPDEMYANEVDGFNEPAPFDNPPPLPQSTPTTSSATPSTSTRPGGDRIRIQVGDQPLVVTGGSFQAMLTAIKNIPGRRFNGAEKIWQIPDDVSVDSVNQSLQAAGFMLEAE